MKESNRTMLDEFKSTVKARISKNETAAQQYKGVDFALSEYHRGQAQAFKEMLLYIETVLD